MTGESLTSAADVCDRRLLKVLAELDAADVQIASKNAEIVNKDQTIKRQDERFVAVLAILQEYTTLDKKAKKSFWGKVGGKLSKLLDAATEPETIRAILLTIAVVNAGK